MAKRRKSKYFKSYNTQRKRILRLLKRYEKIGIDITPFKIPEIPKTIRKESVRRLKNITADKIRSKLEFIDIETGEVITFNQFSARGYTLKQLENVSRETFSTDHYPLELSSVNNSQVPIESSPVSAPDPEIDTAFFETAVLDDFYSHIATFNSNAIAVYTAWLERMIQTIGLTDTCYMLEQGRNDGAWIGRKAAYDDEKVHDSIESFMEWADLNSNERSALMDELSQTNSFFSDFYTFS